MVHEKLVRTLSIALALATLQTGVEAKNVIDVHVHLAILPDGKNGCLVSDKMRHSLFFRLVVHRFGLPLNDPARANQMYLTALIRAVSESKYVGPVVLLAMDGVYKDDGTLDTARTDFMIPNDYVLALAKKHPTLFKAGVSINPRRKDAVAELERCVKEGAVLVKILPNTQVFNPNDPAFIPFYKAMARRHIPLLCHSGYEFALIGNDQSLGALPNLRLPLDTGVTVIAAHGGSYGLGFYEPYWKTLQEFVKTYPNFYWDASALSLPDRVDMLLRLRRRPELQGRMVFGTDYPVPSMAYPALLVGKWRGYWELLGIKNSFDRHYRLLQLMGLPQPVPFSRVSPSTS
jgi:uncharacterized protein